MRKSAGLSLTAKPAHRHAELPSKLSEGQERVVVRHVPKMGKALLGIRHGRDILATFSRYSGGALSGLLR